MKNSSFMLFVVMLVIAAATGYFIASKKCSSPIGNCVSEKRCALRTGMRKLWADHVIWMRDYSIAAVAGSGDSQVAAQRLTQNQEDIGNALIPYYGKEAGHKLTSLLKEHIAIAVDIIDAAKLNQPEKVIELDEKWHANANDIAAFLSNANSNWPEADLAHMLNAHLKLTTDELKARLASNWKEDIAAFDKIFAQIMDMADQLTNGIAAQFPKKF